MSSPKPLLFVADWLEVFEFVDRFPLLLVHLLTFVLVVTVGDEDRFLLFFFTAAAVGFVMLVGFFFVASLIEEKKNLLP